MATSSFTTRFELSDEGLDRLIKFANSEDKAEINPIKLPEYDIDNEDFIQECLGLSDCKE